MFCTEHNRGEPCRVAECGGKPEEEHGRDVHGAKRPDAHCNILPGTFKRDCTLHGSWLLLSRPRRHRQAGGRANRVSIFLPVQTPTWCLLYELAHAMTPTMDRISNSPGAAFMWVNVWLLARHLWLDLVDLIRIAQGDPVPVEAGACPAFPYA